MDEFITPATTSSTTSKLDDKDKKMSIWGNVNSERVSDDPFFTPANTYHCTVIDAKMQQKDGRNSLTIQWAIDDPSSDYHGNRLSQYFQLPADGQNFEDLDSNQRKSLAFLKQTLRRGFDFSEQPNSDGVSIDNVSPSDLMGRSAYLTVKVNDKYSNVNKVVCPRLYEEEREQNQVAESLGL